MCPVDKIGTDFEEDVKKQSLREKFREFREIRTKKQEKHDDLLEKVKEEKRKEIRKRKKEVKREKKVKKEKFDNKLEVSTNNSKFDWKHFLTSAPLEEDAEESNTKCDDSNIQKFDDDEYEEEELDVDGRIKDVDVPREMLELARINKKILSLERKNKHLNKDAWNSLFGDTKPKEPVDSNYTRCEFCNVLLNVKNIVKHHKKCSIKFGMKT